MAIQCHGWNKILRCEENLCAADLIRSGSYTLNGYHGNQSTPTDNRNHYAGSSA